LTEYASSPTPFWMVKLMDLGIIVPAAIATGTGLLQRSAWAWRAVYPLLTGYTCLGVSVTAMGLVMNLEGDPDASPELTTGFLLFALTFLRSPHCSTARSSRSHSPLPQFKPGSDPDRPRRWRSSLR
jgi:hypothetical protein